MTHVVDTWTETCLIEITKKDDSPVQFAAITETVDIDQGDKDIEQIANLKGGRILKYVPQEITTITFEGYPLDVDSAGGTGVSQMFQGYTWDTTEPMITKSSITRDKFQVAILWTNDTAATTASGTTSTTTDAYRWWATNCRMVSCKPSFTDGVLKFTFAFKVAPFDRTGTAQINEESGDQTAVGTIAAYS